MANGAIVGEDFGAGGEIRARLGLQAGERAHVIGDGRDLIGLQGAVAAERRHRSLTTVIVAGARAVGDGLRDGGERAAPQPVVVVEVRIALGAAAAGAVTGRAIVGKGAPAERAGEVEQFRRRLDLLQRSGSELGHHRAALRLQRGEFLGDGAARMPVERAVGIGRDQRPGRIDDPVADREHDAGVEQPQPPARQRRVEFGDAVPFMAGGADLGFGAGMFRIRHFSILPQRQARLFVEVFLKRGPERVDEHCDEQHEEVDQPPGLGEMCEKLIGLGHGRSPQRMLALSS